MKGTSILAASSMWDLWRTLFTWEFTQAPTDFRALQPSRIPMYIYIYIYICIAFTGCVSLDFVPILGLPPILSLRRQDQPNHPRPLGLPENRWIPTTIRPAVSKSKLGTHFYAGDLSLNLLPGFCLHVDSLCLSRRYLAMGQNSNRTLSEHPNPTTKIVLKWVVNSPTNQNGIPLVLTQRHTHFFCCSSQLQRKCIGMTPSRCLFISLALPCRGSKLPSAAAKSKDPVSGWAVRAFGSVPLGH